MRGEAEEGAPDETRTGYGTADEESAADEGVEGGLDALHPTGGSAARCELCGGPVEERHCKIVCLNCGYKRDCSDP